VARWRPHHLDQRFLYTALTPTVTLDDGGLEGLLAQLRHLQLHFASLGLQAALAVAGARILLTFHRRAHHLTKVIPYPGLIDVDHVPHRLVFSLVHCRSSQSERNQSKNKMCERFCTLSDVEPTKVENGVKPYKPWLQRKHLTPG
jgi:hypothetical protein